MVDTLKIAFQLVARKAREDRAAGKIPLFLGAQGMLARMYDKITEFSSRGDDPSLLLDIAVSAVFAFSTTIPNEEIEDDMEEDEVDNADQEAPQEEEAAVDPRWTPIAPNKDLPQATRNNKSALEMTDEEDDDE